MVNGARWHESLNMGWETRERGGRYYTQSYRQGGQVKRRYIGAGILGELAAQFDEERRLEAEIAREEERARILAIDALLEAWHETVMNTQGLSPLLSVCIKIET